MTDQEQYQQVIRTIDFALRSFQARLHDISREELTSEGYIIKEEAARNKTIKEILEAKYHPSGQPMLAVLKEDQKPPEVRPGMFPQIGACASDGYEKAERDMLKDDWRAVLQPERK